MEDKLIRERLEKRLGRTHARQRIGIEAEHEAHVFGEGVRFFHIENWYSIHGLIRGSLKMVGLYRRAQSNAHNISVVYQNLSVPRLPKALNGIRILHLSDLHIDMNEKIVGCIIEKIKDIQIDLCVLTGDYRYRTYGATEAVIKGMAHLFDYIHCPTYAVLGNHDSVKMLPEFEDMGIRVLMNEHIIEDRDSELLYIAGIDDAHFFGVHNIEKAFEGIPSNGCILLLSHTPEIYRQAAHAGANVFLCGHTHGGQICLPGGYPLTLDANIPRKFGRGLWEYSGMIGYTSSGAGSSIVDARLNCRPEITVHTLTNS